MQTHHLCLPSIPPVGSLSRLTGRLVAALTAAGRRRQLQRSTLDTLRSLDDRTLRDLGLHRSELGSVAAEVGGRVEPSYLRVQQGRHLAA